MLINWVCPICKNKLEKLDNAFKCGKCRENWETQDGIVNFLPKNLGKIKEVEKETYSYRANEFNEIEALKVGRKDFVDPLRKLGKGALILELCGGAAKHALNLMKEEFKVVESDIAPGSVKKAKEFAEKLGVANNGCFAVIDAENLPFLDNTFQGVFLIASLHHLPSPEKALKEINRVLCPGGTLLIGYEPNTWHYYLFYPLFKLFRYLIRHKSKHPISIADDETFGFSKFKLRKLIKEAGLELTRITPVNFWPVFYKKGVELMNKLTGKKWGLNSFLEKVFRKMDKMMFKVPLISLLALNYDAEAKKNGHDRP